jgi:hypothetical protein
MFMKTFVYLAIVLLMVLGACQKENETINPQVPSTSVDTGTLDPGDSGDSLIMNNKVGTLTGYQVSPRFGRPNSTYYTFKVYDPIGTLSLSVKLYDKASGTINYYPMTKNGSYWMLSKKISTNGWYDYRYVYTSNHANINTTTYQSLCNTKNSFNSSPYLICWPFGADGSSWSNRTINGQKWRGGEETKGTSYHYGFGWNEGTHTGTTEKYSDDWNRGTGSQDLGAVIKSPLDGYIETIGEYYVSGCGYSKYISIIQESSDGKLYRFYVSHLKTTASGLYSDKYVRAGIDQIGTLGMSGASSPHAHTNMRLNGVSVPFYFNAQ